MTLLSLSFFTIVISAIFAMPHSMRKGIAFLQRPLCGLVIYIVSAYVLTHLLRVRLFLFTLHLYFNAVCSVSIVFPIRLCNTLFFTSDFIWYVTINAYINEKDKKEIKEQKKENATWKIIQGRKSCSNESEKKKRRKSWVELGQSEN